jgi:hypothetical protein
MYILDTNVISELRKGKKAEQRVSMWAQALPVANLYLSVVSVLELEIGALLVERRDRKQGAILRAWIDGHVLPSFSGRILAIDTVVAQRCASLHWFCTRTYNRILRPGLASVLPQISAPNSSLRRSFDKLDQEVTAWDPARTFSCLKLDSFAPSSLLQDF